MISWETYPRIGLLTKCAPGAYVSKSKDTDSSTNKQMNKDVAPGPLYSLTMCLLVNMFDIVKNVSLRCWFSSKPPAQEPVLRRKIPMTCQTLSRAGFKQPKMSTNRCFEKLRSKGRKLEEKTTPRYDFWWLRSRAQVGKKLRHDIFEWNRSRTGTILRCVKRHSPKKVKTCLKF